MDDATLRTVILGGLGAAVFAGGSYGIRRVWRQPGLRTTQRWSGVLAIAPFTLFLGTALIYLALPASPATAWAMSVFVLVLAVATPGGFITLAIARRLESEPAKMRDAELGIPTQPTPVPFLSWPFWTITFAGAFVLLFAATPWVVFAIKPGPITADSRAPWDPSTTSGLIVLTAFVSLAVSAIVGLAVSATRWRLRRLALSRHAALVTGIEEQRRAAYEDGFAAGYRRLQD
ncbi:hypothetical protein [Microbacterium arborescens]